MREANAARLLTVVLATAGLSACSGSVDTTSTSTGSTTGGGGATTGTTSTTTTTTTTTTGTDSNIADALPPPLECNVVGDGHTFKPSAALVGTTLSVQIDFDYASGQYPMGWSGTPGVSADASLGKVTNVQVSGTSLTVTVEIAAGSAGGSLTMTGGLDGYSGPPSYGQITCPVTRTFKVDLTGATPQIALRDASPAMPLGPRPRVALALVGADGLHAKVRATGLPEGAAVELDTTGGVAEREGSLVDWALPAEPGLYQLELVVRRGGSIATSAIAVEVKEAKG